MNKLADYLQSALKLIDATEQAIPHNAGPDLAQRFRLIDARADIRAAMILAGVPFEQPAEESELVAVGGEADPFN